MVKYYYCWVSDVERFNCYYIRKVIDGCIMINV